MQRMLLIGAADDVQPPLVGSQQLRWVGCLIGGSTGAVLNGLVSLMLSLLFDMATHVT